MFEDVIIDNDWKDFYNLWRWGKSLNGFLMCMYSYTPNTLCGRIFRGNFFVPETPDEILVVLYLVCYQFPLLVSSFAEL